jgi:hypothetical protein
LTVAPPSPLAARGGLEENMHHITLLVAAEKSLPLRRGQDNIKNKYSAKKTRDYYIRLLGNKV